MNDTYTKIILTVIAACLLAIVVKAHDMVIVEIGQFPGDVVNEPLAYALSVAGGP
jgi:hypothetical protein